MVDKSYLSPFVSLLFQPTHTNLLFMLTAADMNVTRYFVSHNFHIDNHNIKDM